MLTDEEMYERMANGWRAGRPETVCGNGSMLENTVNIRQWLPILVQQYGIRRVCDAGAGDMYWLRHMNWAVQYRAFDLIVRDPAVTKIDITKEALPPCDAILCRMVLNHLVDGPERIQMALALFRQSAKYLIATQFDGPQPCRSKQFFRLDLRAEPFNLGAPLEAMQDGAEEACRLALWNLT